MNRRHLRSNIKHQHQKQKKQRHRKLGRRPSFRGQFLSKTNGQNQNRKTHHTNLEMIKTKRMCQSSRTKNRRQIQRKIKLNLNQKKHCTNLKMKNLRRLRGHTMNRRHLQSKIEHQNQKQKNQRRRKLWRRPSFRGQFLSKTNGQNQNQKKRHTNLEMIKPKRMCQSSQTKNRRQFQRKIKLNLNQKKHCTNSKMENLRRLRGQTMNRQHLRSKIEHQNQKQKKQPHSKLGRRPSFRGQFRSKTNGQNQNRKNHHTNLEMIKAKGMRQSSRTKNT